MYGNPSPLPPPPNDDVGTSTDLPLLSPTQAYPSCNAAEKLPPTVNISTMDTSSEASISIALLFVVPFIYEPLSSAPIVIVFVFV